MYGKIIKKWCFKIKQSSPNNSPLESLSEQSAIAPEQTTRQITKILLTMFYHWAEILSLLALLLKQVFIQRLRWCFSDSEGLDHCCSPVLLSTPPVFSSSFFLHPHPLIPPACSFFIPYIDSRLPHVAWFRKDAYFSHLLGVTEMLPLLRNKNPEDKPGSSEPAFWFLSIWQLIKWGGIHPNQFHFSQRFFFLIEFKKSSHNVFLGDWDADYWIVPHFEEVVSKTFFNAEVKGDFMWEQSGIRGENKYLSCPKLECLVLAL